MIAHQPKDKAEGATSAISALRHVEGMCIVSACSAIPQILEKVQRDLMQDSLAAAEQHNPVAHAWQRAMTLGCEAENSFLTTLEDAIVEDPEVLLLILREHCETLPPHQIMRLAAAAWPKASPAIRTALSITVSRVIRKFFSTTGPTSEPTRFLTRSQTAGLDRVVTLGNAFFSGFGASLPMRPRYQPLIAGPSGVGKTEICREAATTLNAQFVNLSISEWIPVGARAEPWTVFVILDAALGNDRTLLLIDELDKAQTPFASSWSQSVMGEVFRCLDDDVPLEAYARVRKLECGKVREQLTRRMFRVGAGTWQSHWRERRSIGFLDNGDRIPFETIQACPGIPEELLLRFTLPPVILSYPDAAETETLFKASGLHALAEQLGAPLNPASHDWTSGGMRTLQALISDLCVRAAQNTSRRNSTPEHEDHNTHDC